MNNTNSNTQTRVRFCIFAASIIFVIILSVYAIISVLNFSGGEMLSREQIEANIQASVDEDYSYVASYLVDWGIRGFDRSKFKTCEFYFSKYSIYAVPETRQLAKEVSGLFLEYFYDDIDKSDSDELTDALLNCYVEAFGDRYAVYRTASEYDDYTTDMSGSFVGIGVQVRYDEENKTILVVAVNPESAAEEAGILEGDEIYAVDGVTVESVGYDSAVSKIRGEIGTEVTVTVKREGELINLVAVRRQIVEMTVIYEMLEDKIAVITITGFKGNTADQFKSAVDQATADGAKGIVFDLRNNPGGYLASVVEVIDYIVEDGVRIASYASSTEGETVFASDDGHSIDLPIAVLFNEYTASAGELFSAAMRDYGAMGVLDVVTVGVRTYSKGVMQSTIGFLDGSTLTLTIAFYNPPCDVNYDGEGVSPDVPVEDVKAQLERAVSELKAKIN